MNAVRDAKARSGMPTSLVYDDDNPFSAASTHRPGEMVERDGVGLGVDRWHEQPLHVSGRRANESVEIGPFVSAGHSGSWPFSARCPNPPKDWDETDASLILAPQFES